MDVNDKNPRRDRQAYCILAHHEPELLGRLLHALDDARNDIFVLVDAKADARPFDGLACEQARLFWTPRRAVYWGDLSFARAELLLFRSARQAGHHAYYHLLSGVDFPLKSPDEICQFFKDHQGEEFIEFNANESFQTIARERAGYFYFFVRGLKSENAIRRRLSKWAQDALVSLQRHLGVRRNPAVDFRRGSNWISVTEPLVDWLLAQEDDIARIFSRTLCSDESFVQTLVMRSPFAGRISPLGNLRKIDWSRGDPYCWRLADIDELRASPCLFARKFSSSEISVIDELQGRSSDAAPRHEILAP